MTMLMKKNILLVMTLLLVSSNFLRVSSSEPKTWQNCKEITSESCGLEVHSYVFNGNNKSYVSNACCIQVVEVGKECHDLFTKANLESPSYKSNQTYYLKRSESLWNGCLAEFKGQSPPPVNCPLILDHECGLRIRSSIFHGVGEVTSDKCCEAMIRRGKECHDSLVQGRIARGGFEHNKTEVLQNSDEVWNKCASVAQNLTAVKTCKSNVSFECGRQIGLNVIFNEGSITNKCCTQLLKVGRPCHELLALATVAVPEHQAHGNDILKRSASAWIKCREESKW